jgi:hypothetical protein
MAKDPGVPTRAQVIAIFGGEDEQSLELTVTPELLELLDLTAVINRGTTERFHYSFSGLIIAFYYARHGISEWFRQYLAQQSVDGAAILAYRGILEDQLRNQIRSYELPFRDPNREYPNGRRSATSSALSWIGFAKSFALKQKHEWTGLRHLMGAVIFTPDFHGEDLRRWRIERREWASSYLDYVKRDLPADFDFWRQVNAQTFGLAASELSQDRFSERVWSILARAERARESEKKDRVYTEHLVLGLRQPESRLTRLAEASGIDLDVILKHDFGISQDQPFELHLVPPLSQNAHGALLTARDKANADGSRIIEDTHLLFGVLSQTKSTVVQELNKRGITSDKVAFGGEVLRVGTFAGYKSDDPTGDDLLKISKEVNALASILAATDVDPPLSLGIFGDWGSGKSFFMRRLESRIRELQLDARNASGDSSYCQDIVQLTFNAWNYIDSDLWASLAAEIFEGLAAAIAEKRGGDSQQARALALAAASSSKTVLEEAERRKSRAEEQLKQTEQRLASAQKNEASIEASLTPRDLFEQAYRFAIEQEVVQENLDAAAKELHISEGKAAADAIKAQILELHGIWNAIVFTMRNNEKLWIWPLVFLFALGVSWASIYLLHQVPRIPGLVTNLVGLLVGVSGFLAPFVNNARKALTFIQQARVSKQKLIEEAKARKMADLKKQQDDAKTEVKEAERSVELAQENLRTLNDQLDKMRADRKMADYIRQRNESTDYTQRLGIIARVRADFRQLSTLLRDSKEESESEIKRRQKEKEGDGSRLFPRIDRIILYIDDLDRCPEKNVVEVLQAVHLLLAFPLFVVVVGVDPRWLLHSLGQQAPALQAHRSDDESLKESEDPLWESTPMNYLEKIFQIPFTLRPINKDGFSNIVDAFAKPRTNGSKSGIMPAQNHQTVGTSPGEPISKTDRPAESAPAVDEPTALETSPKPAPITPTVPRPSGVGGQTSFEAINRHPDHLRFEEWERSFMKKLHRLIPSPRAGKRFINIYRLLRASVEENQRSAFVGDTQRGEYQSALLLLAMLIGYPSEATKLFQALIEERPRESWWNFVHAFKDRVQSGVRATVIRSKGTNQADNTSIPVRGRPFDEQYSGSNSSVRRDHADQYDEPWSELFAKLDEIRPDVEDRPSDSFIKWTPRVARYSFQSGRVLSYQRD